MKNKRGQITIGITAVLLGIFLLAVLIFGIAWFITSNIFILVGGAIVLLSLIFGLPASIKNPNQMTIGLTVTFLFAGVCLMLVPVITDGLGFSVGSSDSVWVADYGNIECRENPKEESVTNYLSKKLIINCAEDYLADDCEFKIFNEKSGTSLTTGITFQFYECNKDGVNCGVLQKTRILVSGESAELPKISSGKSYKFVNPDGILLKFASTTKVQQTFNKYQLWVREDGGDFLASSSDCCLANQNELQKNNFAYGDWDCIERGDNRNYFLNWKQVTGAKIYTYDSQKVICRTQALWKITSEKLADGITRNVQGSKIKDVECCPQEDNNCDSSSFTFTQLGYEEERECEYDYQCANGGNPWDNIFSSTSAKIEKCVNYKCVESSISIECDSDAKCRSLHGEGYGCDLTYDNYGKCIEIGKIEQLRCGDGNCTTGETFENCPSDCKEEKLSCEDKGGTFIEGDTIKKGKGPFGIGSLIGLYDEVQEPGKCLIPHVSILALLILAVGIFIIVFAIIKSMPVALIPGTILALIGLAWSILAGIGYV